MKALTRVLGVLNLVFAVVAAVVSAVNVYDGEMEGWLVLIGACILWANGWLLVLYPVDLYDNEQHRRVVEHRFEMAIYRLDEAVKVMSKEIKDKVVDEVLEKTRRNYVIKGDD